MSQGKLRCDLIFCSTFERLCDVRVKDTFYDYEHFSNSLSCFIQILSSFKLHLFDIFHQQFSFLFLQHLKNWKLNHKRVKGWCFPLKLTIIQVNNSFVYIFLQVDVFLFFNLALISQLL